MLKVTLLASLLFLALALEHAESCSSSDGPPRAQSPKTDVKVTPTPEVTPTDPASCKDKNMEDCKLDATKKSCPNKCKKMNKDSKNKGKTNGGTTRANSGNADVKNTTTTKKPNPNPTPKQSSTPKVKDTPTDPASCKNKNLEDCKLDATKKSCPNTCKKINADSKNKV